MERNPVRVKYEKIKQRQKLIIIPLILLTVFAIFMSIAGESIRQYVNSQYFLIATVITAILTMVFSYYNWRCPSCKSYLGRNMSVETCPKCGVRLTDITL